MKNLQHKLPETQQEVAGAKQAVDQSRRSFGKAGLAAPVVLATLASRPVLGATCLTPSAAGSGNHSQHNPQTCNPANPQWWIDNTPKTVSGAVDVNTPWPNTSYKPGDAFHPMFTSSASFEYMDESVQPSGASYNLYEVLTGMKADGSGPIGNHNDPSAVGPWFVAGLLNASSGRYSGVIQAIGPDPSVRGIADEYARNGFFVPTVGKQWLANDIKNFLNDPGSVF